MVKLIVFLGNPGRTYRNSRHNAGWLLADFLYPDGVWQRKFNGEFSTDGSVRLLKPLTFMNQSGVSVRACCDFFRISPEEVLVVHDDLELPFGTTRFQQGGGLQGHNGLRSVKSHLKSDRFHRLRIGIGRPAREDVATYVLMPFSASESAELEGVLGQAGALLRRETEGRQ
jgi:PTH1 family peptidyl-tRNA hydrolase